MTGNILKKILLTVTVGALLIFGVLNFTWAESSTPSDNSSPAPVDLRAINNQDLYKAGITIKAVERGNKIKRLQIQGIKRGPVVDFLKGIEGDGRLDNFLAVLNHLIEFESDACSACWSTFSKIAMVGKEVQGKTSRKSERDSKSKNKKKVDQVDSAIKKIVPSRELSVTVPNLFIKLNSTIRDPEESKGVREAWLVLIDELNQKRSRKPGELDYLSQLGDMIYSSISGDDAYQEEEAVYRNLNDYF
jgi:hypothetical protein